MPAEIRLSANVEAELITKWRAGDKVARNRLVVAQLEYVDYWAKRYAVRSGVAYEDLYADGALGLAEAMDRYDASRGVRLSTYTVQFVRGYMSHAIRKAKQIADAEVPVAFAAENSYARNGTRVASGPFQVAQRQATLASAVEPDLRDIDSAELSAAVRRLPRTQRAIVVRMYLTAKAEPIRDVAFALGITLAQAERLHAKALARLHGYLEATRG